MFSSVSWLNFIFYLTILLIIYYGSVVSIYYRSEFAEFIKTRKTLSAPGPASFTKFKAELEAYFQGCAKLKPIPEEFIMGLQVLVQQSPFVPDAKEKIMLHQYIIESSQRICSITLDPGEVDRIWKHQGMEQLIQH